LGSTDGNILNVKRNAALYMRGLGVWEFEIDVSGSGNRYPNKMAS
jgi:hypothetical protein